MGSRMLELIRCLICSWNILFRLLIATLGLNANHMILQRLLRVFEELNLTITGRHLGMLLNEVLFVSCLSF